MADEYKSIYSGQEVDNAVATAQKALTTDNLVQTTGQVLIMLCRKLQQQQQYKI